MTEKFLEHKDPGPKIGKTYTQLFNEEYEWVTCPDCNGVGEGPTGYHLKVDGMVQTDITTCIRCHGIGKIRVRKKKSYLDFCRGR